MLTDLTMPFRNPAMQRQFALFFVAGCLSTAVFFGFLIVLVEMLGVYPIVASTIAYILGGIVNYCINYRITFRSGKPHVAAVPVFAAVATAGLLLNAGIMALGLEIVQLPYLLAQVMATGIVMCFNFVCHRTWSF
jgi:putative flippase GtrA